MKMRILSTVVGLSALTGLSGCYYGTCRTPLYAAAYADPAYIEVNANPPPLPMSVEVQPPKPTQNAIWVAGYWNWQGSWQWVGGRWEVPRAGYVWQTPTFHVVGATRRYHPGFWRPESAPPPAVYTQPGTVVVTAQPQVTPGTVYVGGGGSGSVQVGGGGSGSVVVRPAQPGGHVVVGGGATVQPGGGSVVVRPAQPGGGVVVRPTQPGGQVIVGGGAVVQPGGGSVVVRPAQPGGGVVVRPTQPGGSVIVGGGAVVQPGGGVVVRPAQPGGGVVVRPGGPVTQPGGGVVVRPTQPAQPGGGVVIRPGGPVTQPGGGVVVRPAQPGGGVVVRPGGPVTQPGGGVVVRPTQPTQPGGGVVIRPGGGPISDNPGQAFSCTVDGRAVTRGGFVLVRGHGLQGGTVQIGGVFAPVTSSGPNQITAQVPGNSSGGLVTVQVGGRSATCGNVRIAG